jgi:hypothetical protein
MKRNALLVLLTALVLVCAPAVFAAKTPPPVAGTTWTGTGTLKAAIQKGGKEKGPADFRIDFGPQGGLAANEFILILDDKVDLLMFPGTYTLDRKGRPVLTPDAGPTETTLTDLFWKYAGGSLPGVTIDLDVTKVVVKAKPRSSNKLGETLKLQTKFTFFVTATVPGQSVRVRTKIRFKATGPKQP